MRLEYAFFNGAFVPMESATIGVKSKAFNYGLGALEGIRGYWNERQQQLYLFRLEDHMVRLLESCKILSMEINYSVKELCEITVELMKINNVKRDIYVRPLVYVKEESLRPTLFQTKNGVTIFIEELIEFPEAFQTSIRTIVSSWLRIQNNTIPPVIKSTAGYLNSALAYTEARMHGADEAILLTRDGMVSEASTSNIFLVKDGVLYTPPIADNILLGITRDTIMKIAERLNIEVRQEEIPRVNLYTADEVFLSGTASELLPVSEIDKRKVGTGEVGPVTEELLRLYREIVRGEVVIDSGYLTAVYE